MKQMQVAFQDGYVRDMFWRQRGQIFLMGEMMVGCTVTQITGGEVGSGRQEGRADTTTANSGENRLGTRPFARGDQDSMEA